RNASQPKSLTSVIVDLSRIWIAIVGPQLAPFFRIFVEFPTCQIDSGQEWSKQRHCRTRQRWRLLGITDLRPCDTAATDEPEDIPPFHSAPRIADLPSGLRLKGGPAWKSSSPPRHHYPDVVTPLSRKSDSAELRGKCCRLKNVPRPLRHAELGLVIT